MTTEQDIKNLYRPEMSLDFKKLGGFVPAIIQNFETREVLMLGFMNQEALNATREKGQVVFWSRSKNRLWHKGEESGNVLNVVSIAVDCDLDTLLIEVIPAGQTCHRGTVSCFDDLELTDTPLV